MEIDEHIAANTQPHFLCDRRFTAGARHLLPEDLITALWVQFSDAVSGGKEYARCKECGAWFETSLPAARKTRVYCSDNCKVRSYLERKETAIRLKAEGKTVKQIADQLGTDRKPWRGG